MKSTISKATVRAMNQFDRKKSLQELEGNNWGEATFDSFLVGECHRLRRVPLREFTVENLRLMIGQSLGLPYLVPLALEHLRQHPLAEGNYYPGDLLTSVLLVDAGYWHRHPNLSAEVRSVAHDTLERLRASGHKKQERFRTTFDSLNDAYETFSRAQTTLA